MTNVSRLTPLRLETLAWALVLVVAALALGRLGYEARDPDSRLYAEIAARMAAQPVSTWIAPTCPPGWYLTGLFREHPVGIHVLPALLIRLGYPAGQAAFLANALYQVLSLVLLQRLAATLAPGLEARALGWMVQLLPIAFTFRIRANHEQAVLLCLLLALLGVDRARRHRALGLAAVAGLVGLLLVKGVLVVMGLGACALWVLLVRPDDDPRASRAPAVWTLLAAVLAVAATAWVYEQMYERATGQEFWSIYLARQLGAAAVDQSAAGFAHKAANLFWYLARVVWFPFPWSLTLAAAVWKSRGRTAGAPGSRSALVFVLWLTVFYLAAFSLSDRRADRYIFPVYYAVGAAGAVAALRGWSRLHDLAFRLDRVFVPAAVWIVTFGLHVVGGILGVPTVKLWAPDS